MTNRDIFQLKPSLIDKPKVKKCFREKVWNGVFWKVCSETGPSTHLSNLGFHSQYIEKTYAMRFIFFSECLINYVKFGEKAFSFLDNCVWIGRTKFFLQWLEYLSLTVNELKTIFKISDLTKRDLFQLHSSLIDESLISFLRIFTILFNFQKCNVVSRKSFVL